MIAIIDYGLGNPASVRNMIQKAGGNSVITSDPEVISKAEKLILPGVGSFGVGMENLRSSGLDVVLKEQVAAGAKLLGICLGAQLLTRSSEESPGEGLGLIAAHTKRFSQLPDGLKIPHMGWSRIHTPEKVHPLLQGLPPEPRFYFVHSYFLECEREDDVLCRSHYGHDFASGIGSGGVVGIQFHPEKSHVFGLALMKNVLTW